MNGFFNYKTEDEMALYLKMSLEEYQKECREFGNPNIVYAYLLLLLHYLVTQRPRSEQNAYSILKLLGATQKEPGYRYPFFSIMARCAQDCPADQFFQDAAIIEDKITTDDINEIYDFIEWKIMGMEDEEEKEELLGEMAVTRVKYLRDKRHRIVLKRGRKGPAELKPEFRRQCEKFAKEYTPQKIKEYLDRYIIGQEEAKRSISTAVYNHYLRILYPDKRLIKSNVIMVGPSGCGKTEIMRRIKELVNVPVIISDFSGVVATPWKGRNKEEALLHLYNRTGGDLAMTERGIVFYDEFDKIIPVRNYKYGGDINDELQGQMLGMMEGTMVEVPTNSGNREKITMNTENMLFICAGAFEGLEDIVKKDLPEMDGGFGMPFNNNQDIEITQDNIKVEHLIKYGMKPELAGRIGIISVLRGLSREDLRRVLTEPQDSVIKRYQNEFMAEDAIKLSFTEGALDAVIDRVMEMNIGARALNSVLHDVLVDAMFEAPSHERITEVVITEGTVRDGAAPDYR